MVNSEDFSPWRTSVWEGSDAELLRWAIPLYFPNAPAPPPILDATYGSGRFWKGTTWRVEGLDILPTGSIRANNQMIPFKDEVFGVVVFDPPHMAERHIGKDYGGLMGLYQSAHERNSSVPLFTPFLLEAARVLFHGGILLAKITDNVHRGVQQWEHIAFISAVRDVGLIPCDLIIKVRKGPMMDPKWKNQYHVRKRHCFWVVARKGWC